MLLAVGTAWAAMLTLHGRSEGTAFLLLGGLLNGYHVGRDVERALNQRQ